MIPVKNQILFKPFPPDIMSEGGIFVPESAREESNRGLIVAVGNGSSHKKMTLKPGQVAYRVKAWGTPVEINGEMHYLMEDAAIIATE
jgi:chaperonin GroES